MWSGPARRDPTCRRPAARSASAGSKRPSRTTCAGSPTGGRRCRATAARSCCTRRITMRPCRRSASHGVRKVIDLWAERTTALGATRRRRLRARVRESGRRGRRDHRPSARPDLRLRPCAAATGLAAGRRLEARGRLRRPVRGRAPIGHDDTAALDRVRARGIDVSDRADARTRSSRCPTCRRSATPAATRWRRCWSTSSIGSTGCTTSRCRT